MSVSYKFNGKNVVEIDKDKENDLGTLEEFLLDERELLDSLFLNISDYVGSIFVSPGATKQIKNDLTIYMTTFFKKAFKANKNELNGRELRKLERKIEQEAKDLGIVLFNDTKNYIYKNVNKLLKNKKITGGTMFKTLKEARNFTAHLDSLANEIENLDEVSVDMKHHLAFRLDRLSDLIEADSNSTEKKATLEKEANGIGQGAWLHDADETYMNTFGGTGALEKDADEPYMAEFSGDDHMEVINRQEPKTISEDGSKKPQPSDSIKQREPSVVNKLKKKSSKITEIVKAVLAEME